MLSTLRRLAQGATESQTGWHFGTLKALVTRGLAETYRSESRTEYRITPAGREVTTAAE